MKLASCLKYYIAGICICLTWAASAAGGRVDSIYVTKMQERSAITDTIPRNPAKSEQENKGATEKNLQGTSDKVTGKVKEWQIKEVPRARPQAVPRIVSPPGLMKPKIIKPKIITKGIGR